MFRKLRVCQVSAAYYPYPSGLSEHIHHLTAALRNRGHDVEILTTSFAGGEPTEEGVTRFGRALLLKANKSYATVPVGLRMSGQVRRFLAAGAFDVVHLHGIFPPEISFWALRHSRSVNVITFHTVGFRRSLFAERVCRVLMGHWNRKLLGRIVETQAALSYTQPYFPGEYRIIPAGVDTLRFHPQRAARSEKREARRVLFVGRLDARKGLAVLLRAMPIVRQQVPDVRLDVVGKGPLEDRARRLVEKLGIRDIVTFHGFVTNEALPGLYAAADVYCAPSLGGEAFGIVLLEAMASGTPVIASNITGYNEVVKDGETGLLVPPDNPAALAETILRLLDDAALAARLRANGLAWAGQHSWNRIAERIEAHYLELLSRRPYQCIV